MRYDPHAHSVMKGCAVSLAAGGLTWAILTAAGLPPLKGSLIVFAILLAKTLVPSAIDIFGRRK